MHMNTNTHIHFNMCRNAFRWKWGRFSIIKDYMVLFNNESSQACHSCGLYIVDSVKPQNQETTN